MTRATRQYTQTTLLAAIGIAFVGGGLTGAAIASAAASGTVVMSPENSSEESDRKKKKKKRRRKKATDRSAAAAAEPSPPPPPETPAQKLAKASTLDQALTITRPLMGDSYNELDTGMLALGMWSLEHLTWKDVAVLKNETSIKSTMKDPDGARGKRMCARGSLIQIEVFKLQDGRKGFEGLMWDNRRQLIKFVAAKSTGELVANSPARFCGVVTGKYSYANSGGGTGHAVAMVGMFDLPENRK
jgi:hypothetical protein